jgi:RHS repeat-associated protein
VLVTNEGFPTVSLSFSMGTDSVWFGGRLVQKGGSSVPAPDRLGSIGRYLPYGEERTGQSGNPANGNEKFATYTRDGVTGLDYADQRWYAQGQGRFLTSDPYTDSATTSKPSKWNRYQYVTGDPLLRPDPTGLDDERTFCDVYPSSPECIPFGFPPDFGPTPTFTPNKSIFGNCNPDGNAETDRQLEYMLNLLQQYSTIRGPGPGSLPASWVVGWAIAESGWGSPPGVAGSNGNYFGLRQGVNWRYQVACGAGTNSAWACFAGFASSAASAVESPRPGDWTVEGLFQRLFQGWVIYTPADAQAFFQLVASLGHDPGNLGYGARVMQTIGLVETRISCLRNLGEPWIDAILQ